MSFTVTTGRVWFHVEVAAQLSNLQRGGGACKGMQRLGLESA